MLCQTDGCKFAALTHIVGNGDHMDSQVVNRPYLVIDGIGERQKIGHLD